MARIQLHRAKYDLQLIHSVWFVLAITALYIGSVGLTPVQSMEAQTIAKNHLVIGVCVHIFTASHKFEESLKAIRTLGAASLRVDAQWRYIERHDGHVEIPSQWDKIVQSANKLGIKPLLILDYGNSLYEHGQKPSSAVALNGFKRYVDFVTKHFRGQVLGYEIWNEWDGRTGHTNPGSPFGYMRMVKIVSPIIRTNDPGALILGGSVTSIGIRDGFLDRLIKLGLTNYIDGISIHPYVQCRRNSTIKSWSEWLRSIEHRISGVVGASVPLYITEIGWPTSIGKCGVSEAKQAELVAGAIRAARQLPFVHGIWWYELIDSGPSPFDRQDRFGLLRNDMTPKPAFGAFKEAVTAASKQ